MIYTVTEKTSLCCHSRCLSVRPSSVEMSLERGCAITNMPIGLKFGLNIGGRVMHVERRDFLKFVLQVANLCNLIFFCDHGFDKPIVPI